ncbi:ABC transporter substrate-binding protein [Cupriavidus necator]|uniref:ABC transporter substrate-binding protein n=1 Tax=Cupriavidus necator TaxID=106590 RepID=A0A1U9UMF9_CUPNE|nr:tripartite tricarboxylate transporter substrate binding protein [Cupriavidus necator]AQV93914.1 ABC transporter substrate-binding protein [Cupriavidus necator]
MASVSRLLASLSLTVAALCGGSSSFAGPLIGKWPDRPIHMIVPASAGSGSDVMARAMAQRLGNALGQSVVVENKPGASGMIGTNAVVKAAPDGYTLLYTNASFAVVAPAVIRSITFDPTRDLLPIAQTAAGGVLLIVNKDLPVTNLRELVELVKANPGQYTYGTWANGSSGNLMMEWLKTKTGMKMSHVAYRSVPQLLAEMSAGVLKIGWVDPVAPLPLLRSERIRCIAVSGNVRAPQLLDVPTLGEQGFQFDTVGWFGMFAPPGTDAAIVARLADEVNKIQGSEGLKELMKNMNFEPPPIKTQKQFRDIVATDLNVWKQIATNSDIKIEN